MNRKKSVLGTLQEGQSWWDLEPPLGKNRVPAVLTTTAKNRPSPTDVDSFREKGETMIADATAAHVARREASADGDDKFMEQMLKAGTLADQVAAMTLRVQQSPIHGLPMIDQLLKLCGKGNHRGARLALEALVDLFRNNLLPEHRSLISLESRPLLGPPQPATSSGHGNPEAADLVKTEHVLVWVFEAGLKTRFSQFTEHISTAQKDNTPEFRKFGLDCAADLLETRPEQERTLLAMCMNKLGDPDRKVASRAMYRLQLLLKNHGAMAGTVVKFAQSFLSRTNLSPRGVYNGVIFLNQVYLERGDHALASSLVRTYLSLFEAHTQQHPATSSKSAPSAKSSSKSFSKDKSAATAPPSASSSSDPASVAANQHETELKSRLLAAILTGVARAQPYLKPMKASSAARSGKKAAAQKGDGGVGGGGEEEDDDDAHALEGHVDTIFRMVHVGNFGAATQALSILFTFISSSKDTTTMLATAPVAGDEKKSGLGGGAQQQEQQDGKLTDRFYRALYARLGSHGKSSGQGSGGHGGGNELVQSSKPTLFLNLVFKAMRDDPSPPRAAAFAKRLLQQTLQGPAQHAAASLFLLSHVAKHQPLVRELLTAAAASTSSNSSSLPSLSSTTEPGGGGGGGGEDTGLQTEPAKAYDVGAREPKGAHAGPVWEWALMAQHYHPSVQVFAKSLGGVSTADDDNDLDSLGSDDEQEEEKGEAGNKTKAAQGAGPQLSGEIVYAGDPLVDFQLMPFLDKMVYKQAKKLLAPRRAGAARMGAANASAAASAAASAKGGLDAAHVDVGGAVRGLQGEVLATMVDGESGQPLALTAKAFLEVDEDDLAPDQRFFHKYFTAKQDTKARKRHPHEKEEDDEEGGDDEDGSEEEEEDERRLLKSAVNDDDDEEDDGEGGSEEGEGDSGAFAPELDSGDEDEDDEDGDYKEAEGGMDVATAQRLLDEDEDTDEEERAFADGLASQMMAEFAAKNKNQKNKKKTKGGKGEGLQLDADGVCGDVDEVPEWALLGNEEGDEERVSAVRTTTTTKKKKGKQSKSKGVAVSAVPFVDSDSEVEEWGSGDKELDDSDDSDDEILGAAGASDSDDEDDDGFDGEDEEGGLLEAALRGAKANREQVENETKASARKKAARGGLEDEDEDEDDDGGDFGEGLDFSDSDGSSGGGGGKMTGAGGKEKRAKKVYKSPFASADDFADMIDAGDGGDDDEAGSDEDGADSQKRNKKRGGGWEEGSSRSKRRKEGGEGKGKGKSGSRKGGKGKGKGKGR